MGAVVAQRTLVKSLPEVWAQLSESGQLIEALVLQGRLDDARELVSFAARSLPEEDAYARACLLLAEASVSILNSSCSVCIPRWVPSSTVTFHSGPMRSLHLARLQISLR